MPRRIISCPGEPLWRMLLPAEIEGADLKKEAEIIRPMLKEFGLEEFENYSAHARRGCANAQPFENL